jgi:hypothetical protein
LRGGLTAAGHNRGFVATQAVPRSYAVSTLKHLGCRVCMRMPISHNDDIFTTVVVALRGARWTAGAEYLSFSSLIRPFLHPSNLFSQRFPILQIFFWSQWALLQFSFLSALTSYELTFIDCTVLLW